VRLPSAYLEEGLRYSRDGSVHAEFIIGGAPYGLRPLKDKALVRDAHMTLLRALPGESLLLGVTASVDPDKVRQAMAGNVDLAACPDWDEEIDATMARIDAIRPGERVYWLSVPMGRVPASQAFAGLLDDFLGRVPARPGPATVNRHKEAAKKTLRAIPAVFGARLATPAQMAWLHDHQTGRGVWADPPVPDASFEDRAAVETGRAFDPFFVDEGGTTDLGGLRRANPMSVLRRPFVKILPWDAPDGRASYQGNIVVSGDPPGELPFPGAELLGLIDQTGIPVDWAIRLRTRPGAQAAATIEKAAANLADQLDQGDSQITRAAAMAEVGRQQAELAGVLTSDQDEVEARATIILSVASGSPDTTAQLVDHLRRWMKEAGYKTMPPPGYQSDLFWAAYPGTAPAPVVRQFERITTSAGLAALVPLASARAGDRGGLLVGIDTTFGPMLGPDDTCGQAGLVFWDPEGAVDRNESPSLAVIGDLGAGKSFAIKKFAGAIVDRGGAVIVPDRTAMAEWSVWAEAIPGSRSVLVADPAWSLDPLRMLGGDGPSVAASFLCTLLGEAPTSAAGALLHRLLQPGEAARRGVASLGDVPAALEAACREEDSRTAREMADRIRVYAQNPLARAFFDPGLAPATGPGAGDCPALVIGTHGLELPSRQEMDAPQRFAQLSAVKVLGRAVYALAAMLAQRTLFGADRLGAFVVDEAFAAASSPEAEEAIRTMIRDGRKHRVCVVIGTHDVNDLPPALRQMIPNRMVGRMGDPELARDALSYLGLDPDDDALVGMLTRELSPRWAREQGAGWRQGEFVFRDPSQAVCRVKVLPPGRKDRDRAGRTGGANDRPAELAGAPL